MSLEVLAVGLSAKCVAILTNRLVSRASPNFAPPNSSIAQLSMLCIALKGPTPYDIRRSLPATAPENMAGVQLSVHHAA